MSTGATMAGAGQFKAGLLAYMTNAIRLLPPDIQTMTRQQLEQEVTVVFSNHYPADNDAFLRFTVYFGRKGYGDRSPLAASEFQEGYRLSDGAVYRREMEALKELAADGFRVTAPKVYNSLQEYEKANPPIPDIVNIVSRCGQMMHQAETQGADTPYELWRAVLSICKFSTGGTPAIISDLTSGHPDFDMGMTAQKMQDITAPFLCSTFANYEPDICKACRFKGAINSPIALGYIYEPSTKRRAAK